MGLDIHAPTPSTLAPFQSYPTVEERPSLPSLGLSISRPSSRVSTTSTRSLSSSYYSQAVAQHNNVQLPALSALASIATSTPPPDQSYRNGPLLHRTPSMTFTPAPTATPGGASASSAPPVCQNCSTSTTPLWRRDENGSVLCNACGLFLKLHGRPRPISLKTDVIKSRNRVKTAGRGSGKKGGTTEGTQHQSLPAAHPDISHIDPSRRASQPLTTSHQPTSNHSDSPISRTGTPGLNGGHPHNIAPQHLFDAVVQLPNANDPYSTSPPIPQFSFRAHSPGAVSTTSLTNGALSATNGHGSSHLEPPTINHLGEVTALKTRVSELEVINDLFRGRVAELEASEQEARRQEQIARDGTEKLRLDFEDAKRRIEMLEAELADLGGDGHRQKRLRVEDFVREDGSRDGSPLSTPSQLA